MKFSNIKRILVEDFPAEQRQTVTKLAVIINVVFQQLGQIFNKGLSINDNFNQNLLSLSVTVDASGIPLTTTLLKVDLKGKCQGLPVIQALNQTDITAYPINQPFISFSESSGLLTILHVSGLQPENQYNLTVWAVGD